MERRLAAVLAADMVGYSRLMAADESGTIQRQKDHRAALIDPKIAQFGGRIVKTTGDGLLVEFHSIVDAVQCAVEIQRAMPLREAEVSKASRIRYRVGINLGDIIVDGDDILGDGVNIAARLEGLAEPGGICVSDVVRQNLEGKLAIVFEDVGEQTLKNIERKVRVWTWSSNDAPAEPTPAQPTPAEQGAPLPMPDKPLPDKPCIAVLPFANLSGDAAQDYFADGITEDIITELSKNPYLSVISRNSTFSFKGQSVRVREVSAALGAPYLLEGTLRKSGQHIRVTAQLVDAVSDRHLWAERYDRDLDDIFAVQDEVVGSIVHALGASDGILEKSARHRSLGASAASPSAYDCYLQAREQFYRPGDSGIKQAEALYEKAIELDPSFGPAYSGLAMLHFLRFHLFLAASFESIEQKTRDLALHAVRLNPDDYRAHWVLGRLYLYQGKHAQSLAEFDRAIRINPNDANLLVISSETLVYCGRMEEAVERTRHAIRLNPRCPDWYWWQLGAAYFHLGRYEEARETLERMTSADQAGRLLAAVYAHLGRLDEAQAAAATYIAAYPGFSVAEWARTEPFTDPAELRRYVDGMRMAGLPA